MLIQLIELSVLIYNHRKYDVDYDFVYVFIKQTNKQTNKQRLITLVLVFLC